MDTHALPRTTTNDNHYQNPDHLPHWAMAASTWQQCRRLNTLPRTLSTTTNYNWNCNHNHMADIPTPPPSCISYAKVLN